MDLDASFFGFTSALSAIVIVVLTLIDRFKDNKKEPNLQNLASDKLGVGLALFGVITAVSALFAQRMQGIEDQKDAEARDKLRSRIVELQSVAIRKIEKQNQFLSGGDSIPIMYLLPIGQKPAARWQVGVIGQGEYPLRNLGWQIYVYQNGNDCDKNLDSCRLKKSPPKADMLPGFWTTIVPQVVSIGRDKNTRLQIVFSAVNGVWIQWIQFRETEDGLLQYSSKLYSHDRPDVVLFNKGFEETEALETISGIQTPR